MIKKKRAQLEARDASLVAEIGFEFVRKQVARIDVFSIQAMENATPNELADKWEQLEGDYLLLKWKLAMFLSDKFKSKIEFGQFLQELRIANSNHTLCMIKQSTFYRYARAARFCETFKINDLKEIGIAATAIYDLSEIANESVVDEVFLSNIKNKNLPVAEIKRLIYQAHSITGEVIVPPEKVPEQPVPPLETAPDTPQVFAEQVFNESVIIEMEQPQQMTQQMRVQSVMQLLESFEISLSEKTEVIAIVMENISAINSAQAQN